MTSETEIRNQFAATDAAWDAMPGFVYRLIYPTCRSL